MLWARDWALVYGTTAAGVAIVLAAYFAGLAIGAPLGARLVRGRDGLRAYGALELAVALAMLAYLLVRPQLAPLASALTRHVPDGVAPLARGLLAFVVLLVPTIALGATLPAIAAVLARDDAAGAARLYAWNTLGGAAGAPLTGFVGIRWLGLRGTSLAAIGVDVAVASAAWTVARRRGAPAPTAVVAQDLADDRAPIGTLAQAFTVGFVALAAQVLWTRGLSGVLSNSAYSVTLVLTATLVGIVAGAAVASRALARRTEAAVAAAAAAAAILIAGSRVVLEALPAWSLGLVRWFGAPGATSGLAVEAILATAVVLPPSAAMGAVLPLLLPRGAGDPSAAFGRLLAANTCGGIAGACAAAFVMLPRLGLGAGLLALAAVLVAAVALPARGARIPVAVAIAAIALTALRGTALPLPWRQTSDDRILFYRDGAEATVTVTADARDQKRLRVNGQYSLGGTSGLLLEGREAHVPLLLHPAPRRLLHLGVGTGDTIGAASVHPDLAIDGVELVGDVLDAAALFARENRNVLRAPNVRLHADDARSWLLDAGERYDVIVSDLFLPWAAGAGALYSRDLYVLGLAHLAPGGLYCQWLPLHQLAVEDLRSIAATFASVFPHAELWLAYHRNTTPLAALVGSASPLAPDADAIRRRLADPAVGDVVAKVGIVDPADLAVLYVTSDDALRTAVTGAPLVTDDRPSIELTAPAAYFEQERLAPAALAWIDGVLAPGDGPIAGAPAPLALRRALLDAQRALLAGDRPSELRAYLTALPLAPALPTTRFALTAIERERRAAGDAATANVIADALGGQ